MKSDLVFKGRYSAVILSILGHIGVAILLVKSTNFASKPVTKKAAAIKSYIFTPPTIQKTPVETLEPEVVKTQLEQLQEKLVHIEIPAKKDSKISNTVKTRPAKALEKQEETKPITAQTELDKLLAEIKPPEKLQQQKNIKAKSISHSAYSQLEKLNQILDQRFVENETFERYRSRSPSVLDSEPYPAPHSVQKLTPEQKKEKNTTRMSDDLSIIKGDDGLCYIEQDLTNVGIEGVKAISGFKCGQSQFDKNFQTHMKKVIKKLVK